MNNPAQPTVAVDIVFAMFAFAAVYSGWRMFRTDSMVRAAYFLLGSFAGVAAVIVMLGAPFLGLILLLMMGGEMTVMAVFMVMFMMNPAGLNPMLMVHQHRAAKIAGIVSFLGLSAVGVLTRFPDRPLASPGDPTADLGRELLGNSMLVFQTAGFALLATMVGSIALASHRGRFGDAYDSSMPPPLEELDGAAVSPVNLGSHGDPVASAVVQEHEPDAGMDDMAGMDHGEGS